jgi:hypothetical protein
MLPKHDSLKQWTNVGHIGRFSKWWWKINEISERVKLIYWVDIVNWSICELISLIWCWVIKNENPDSLGKINS